MTLYAPIDGGNLIKHLKKISKHKIMIATCTARIHRVVRCSLYLSSKRKEMLITNNIRGLVPFVSDISVTEINSNGKVDYPAYVMTHVEYYFLVWFMFNMIDLIIDAVKNSHKEKNKNQE